MERYKTEILTVAGFLEERPDMEVHTDKTIQSAIYQVAGMLNAKTGGLIQKVWDYSVVDRTNNGNDNGFTQPDPNCVYYRTPEQLAFIKQAFVEQTQYNINLGNDYTQGGGSYSMGNVNASFSRPENRDIFAPMVEYLLQQARVLDLQSFLNENPTIKNSGECMSPELEYDCKCLTENYADKTYLKIYQPDADEGRIATINNAHIITFEPISSLDVCAKSVYDPIEQVCKQINQFGVEYFGGLTKQQIYEAIYAAGVVWSPLITYKKDFIVMFQVNNGTGFYKYAKSLIDDNINNNPNDSPESWEILPIEPIELTQIFNYIDQKFKEFPEVNVISEGDGEIIQFESQSDYEAYKTTMGVDDSYFEDVDTPQYALQSSLDALTLFVNNNTQNIASLNTKVETLNQKVLVNKNDIATKQNKIIINKYKLRDIYYGVVNKTFSQVSGETNNIGGINGLFGVISTTLMPKSNAIYSIQTTGEIGKYNANMRYRAVQLSVYSSFDKVNICFSKLYDDNWDGELYKDNIYIIETIIGE